MNSGLSSTYTQEALTFTATQNPMRVWFDLYPNTTVFLDAFSFEENDCSTCNDGIMNGNEESIDCGGSSCAPCVEGCTDETAHNYDPLADLDYCFCETCDDLSLIHI